jgi:hypothetical protein
MLKSVAVVLGAYLLSVVLVFATDPLLSLIFPGDFATGRIPSDTSLIASTALFVAVSILCAWLCARFSPIRPARHMLCFFLLGELVGIATTVPNWNSGFPHWYALSWLLAWPACCYMGLMLAGRVHEKSRVAGA